MSNKVTIKINGWEKYNPRKDVKNPNWFAFSNRMIEDSDFYDMTHAEFKAWIYCLSRASQKNNEIVEINLTHANKICNLLESDFTEMFNKMQKSISVITDQTRVRHPYAIRTPHVRNPYTTDKQTNKQTHTQTIDQSDKSDDIVTSVVKQKKESFDFDLIYNAYPKKEGKKKGMDKLKREVNSVVKFEQLKLAVKNYSDKCKDTETRFIKQFSSFVSCWEDYIEIEVEADLDEIPQCDTDWSKIEGVEGLIC